MKAFVILISLILSLNAVAQTFESRPKLVIGIVVDQMRNDYLFRYENLYEEGGFLRLMNSGFYSANHHFSYMPTTTGPGHASVYTGTTPAVHGIVGNNWYDPSLKRKVYCAEDKSVRSVGISKESGQMSARNLKVTTITDELELFWNDDSKVMAVSLKDRGAALPAGHLGDGAFWYDDQKFITSSYYMNSLPKWVEDFNNRNLVDTFLAKGWEPLLPAEAYAASLPDNNPYESLFAGEKTPTLPKNLLRLAEENGKDNVLKTSPYGNSLIFEFARYALINERMGEDEITDFLAISLSTPDYMGHAYGPRAVEVQDMYIRLDRDLSKFISFLDDLVGAGEYTLFLTADHGAAEVPSFALESGLPGGYLDIPLMLDSLEAIVKRVHPAGLDLIENVEGNQIYLNREKLSENGLEVGEVAVKLARSISDFPGIYAAYPTEAIRWGGSSEFPLLQLGRGLHPDLCGDVTWLIDSGYMDYGKTGTTHGTAWKYDTHIPLFFYGKGVKPGKTYRETHIRDIAPTLSSLLTIPFPSGATGQPVFEVLQD